MTDWNKWLKKRELCADNILYVYRRDRKTIIHREDGEEFALFAPVYTLLALFPEDAFLNINKGNRCEQSTNRRYQQRWRLYHI